MRLQSNQSKLRRIASTTLIIAVGVGLYAFGYRHGSQSEITTHSDPEMSLPVSTLSSNKTVPTPPPIQNEVPAPSTQTTRERPMASGEEIVDWREKGYEAAKIDLDAALQRAQSMNPREQAYFVSGLFKYIAENSSPRDALTIASAQAGPTRSFALKALVNEWAIDNWSSQDPKGVWNWYSENPGALPANAPDQILRTWARKNPDDIIQSLDTITSPEDRRLAIEAISASLAAQGTDRALDWVESLTNGDERDAGIQAVYKNTPKGIGAVLKVENGFPKIADIMPTGELASTDLRAGDLIVQSRDSGKDPQDLYGKNLNDIVGLLRGSPGSEVEIRVLRENETTGQLEEHSATVVRDLLILESSSRN